MPVAVQLTECAKLLAMLEGRKPSRRRRAAQSVPDLSPIAMG